MIEKLVDAVMRNLPNTSPPGCYTREYVQQRLGMMVPVFATPDHPPYSLMIEQAIAKLNEEGGSSEESISKCITLENDCLPWAHASLLSHHLRKLRHHGEIIYTCDNRYMLPFNGGKGSISPPKTNEKFKKGRGRMHGIHIQNKKLKTDTLMGSQNFETDHKMKQGGPETDGVFDQGETSQPEMLINPRDSSSAAEENTQVEGNEQGSLSERRQYQGPGEANQAAEKINDEPVVKQVQVSDEHCTTVEQLAMEQEQELHVADHDESDGQSIQPHDVILVQHDQVEAQPVSIEDIEQSRCVDSESSSGIMELPRESKANDFSLRCNSTENQNKVMEGQSEKSQLVEMLCQQILMRQNEIGELVGRLKQLTEAPENGVLPCEKFVEVSKRNREIELVLLGMVNTSLQSSNGLVNQSLHEGKAGVPSKDLSMLGDGTAGVRFPLRQCQMQENFIQPMGTTSCSGRPPLCLNFCLRHPDEVAKDFGNVSSGEQKQPELSNQGTQLLEQFLLQQHSGNKLWGSDRSCMVTLQVPAHWEKLLKQQLPQHRPRQLEGTESRTLPFQGLFLGLSSENNEVLPSVSMEERAFPDQSVLRCSDFLEQGLELSESAKFPNWQDGSVKDSIFCGERVEEYPAVLNEDEDRNHDHPVSEPSHKQLELPILKRAEKLSSVGSEQTATEWMTKKRDSLFSAEQSFSARQTPEWPPQNEMERNSTIPIAMTPGLPASLTSTDLLSTKKHYRKRDKSSINVKYREKLRSQNPNTNLIPMNPFSGVANDSPPLTVPVASRIEFQHQLPGILPERRVDARTYENMLPTPACKRRRGRPPKAGICFRDSC